MRVLLLHCIWSHAHCGGCFSRSLAVVLPLLLLILDGFSHLFCYLVVMSLLVRLTKRQQQTMTTTTTALLLTKRRRFKCIFLYTRKVPVVVRFTFNVFTNVNAINSSCVWIAGIRSSGRESYASYSQLQPYKAIEQKQTNRPIEWNGRKRSRKQHQQKKNAKEKKMRTHDENKKMYFIKLYGYRLCSHVVCVCVYLVG